MALSSTELTSGIASAGIILSFAKAKPPADLNHSDAGSPANSSLHDSSDGFDSDQGPKMIRDEGRSLGVTEMESLAQRLAGDAELHKLLVNERMRSEVHKSNYEKLKAEFLRLSHANRLLASELAQLDSDKAAQGVVLENMQHSSRTAVKKLQLQLKHTQAQVPSEAEKIDLEAQLSASLQGQWKSRLEEQSEESEALKFSLTNLLQENLGLKTTLQHMTLDSAKVLDEYRLKHTKQMESLQILNKSLDSDRKPEMEKMRLEVTKLSQDNLRLRSKVKFLETNLEDSVATIRQRDISNARHVAEKSKSESLANARVRQLEAERSELEARWKKTAQELMQSKILAQEQGSGMNLLRNELNSVKNQLVEKENQQSLVLNQLKVSIAKERSSLRVEIDSLSKQVKNAKSAQVKKSTELEQFRREVDHLKRNQDESLATQKGQFASQLAETEARLMELKSVNRTLQKNLMLKDSATGDQTEQLEERLKCLARDRAQLVEDLERCQKNVSTLAGERDEALAQNKFQPTDSSSIPRRDQGMVTEMELHHAQTETTKIFNHQGIQTDRRSDDIKSKFDKLQEQHKQFEATLFLK